MSFCCSPCCLVNIRSADKDCLFVRSHRLLPFRSVLFFTFISVGHFLIKVGNNDCLIGSLSKTTISQAISDLTHCLTLSEVIQ